MPALTAACSAPEISPALAPEELFVAAADGSAYAVLRLSITDGEFLSVRTPSSPDVHLVHTRQRRVAPGVAVAASLDAPIVLADGASFRRRPAESLLDDLRDAVLAGLDIIAAPPGSEFVTGSATLYGLDAPLTAAPVELELAGQVSVRDGNFVYTGLLGDCLLGSHGSRLPFALIASGASVSGTISHIGAVSGEPHEFGAVAAVVATLLADRAAKSAAIAAAAPRLLHPAPPGLTSPSEFPPLPRPTLRPRPKLPGAALLRLRKKKRNSRARRRTDRGAGNTLAIPLHCIPGVMPSAAMSPGHVRLIDSLCNYFIAGYCAFGADCRKSHAVARVASAC
ncbi:uncharacterized protein AMSG_04968 [Thecamonas trahens ATCC 50062]|uniref:C3H1-type domain-containing protein n=1 Tax=Thecamonas trahens ATCC 50062 TaxID=461836 RepID=A0A0L0D857_THETB|nr:hypothetical protein AMSG_04968 [Thecamonas trahens ATCC 50062]KNC48524.1 hypothetical protein AMSG_04968 [Thecamonas trahens ATCC 50062]|eukprot:XP_013758632.1 hypothetical protein AMSG_04968 [Thecamonas trahens ATCC 50062]